MGKGIRHLLIRGGGGLGTGSGGEELGRKENEVAPMGDVVAGTEYRQKLDADEEKLINGCRRAHLRF